MNRFTVIAAGLVAVVAASIAGLAAARSRTWWWDNLAGPDSSNFVASDQINKTNVTQLDVAWFYPYATAGFNPIVVDDVMYLLGRNSSLIALDVTTGKELWIHEGLAGVTSRGVNYWQSEDGKERRPDEIVAKALPVEGRQDRRLAGPGQQIPVARDEIHPLAEGPSPDRIGEIQAEAAGIELERGIHRARLYNLLERAIRCAVAASDRPR